MADFEAAEEAAEGREGRGAGGVEVGVSVGEGVGWRLARVGGVSAGLDLDSPARDTSGNALLEGSPSPNPKEGGGGACLLLGPVFGVCTELTSPEVALELD